jgi:sec-independent protein translocase protein TatC
MPQRALVNQLRPLSLKWKLTSLQMARTALSRQTQLSHKSTMTHTAADQSKLGAMTLAEHFSELRKRLVRSALAIIACTFAVWNQFPPIFAVIRAPYDSVQGIGSNAVLALTGVTSGFSLQLRVSLAAAFVLSSPIWIYQLWRFISPGLKNNERKWAYAFTAVAVPLFSCGVLLAYFVMPRMLDILFQFTPSDVENVTSVESYLSFFLHLTLFFGVGFLLPLVLVTLNFAGILSGERLKAAWRWLILGSFVFGAVATPNGDPLAMTFVALPMITMSFIAVGIALMNDRRRKRAVETS